MIPSLRIFYSYLNSKLYRIGIITIYIHKIQGEERILMNLIILYFYSGVAVSVLSSGNNSCFKLNFTLKNWISRRSVYSYATLCLSSLLLAGLVSGEMFLGMAWCVSVHDMYRMCVCMWHM